MDLLVARGRMRLGFEFKRSSAPNVTRSMKTAIEDLGLSSLTVVHAGEQSFPISKQIRAVSLQHVVAEIKSLP